MSCDRIYGVVTSGYPVNKTALTTMKSDSCVTNSSPKTDPYIYTTQDDDGTVLIDETNNVEVEKEPVASQTENDNSDYTKFQPAYDADILQNAYGFSEAEISQYFNLVNFDNGTLKVDGYQLKNNLVINGKEVASLEDLLSALGKGNPTKFSPVYQNDFLQRGYGFSESEIMQYFNVVNFDNGSLSANGYQLKNGIVINGKVITSLQALLAALGKGDPTKMA